MFAGFFQESITFVTLFGVEFPLVPEGGEGEEDQPLIQLHVPPGAVTADGEGEVEVRYTVIPDGPFKILEGYRLCSTAVYIKYIPAQTTKPFLLSLPQWCGASDHPVFVTSPYTLPEGEQYYPFRLLEGGEFGEGYGIVNVDAHCSLSPEAGVSDRDPLSQPVHCCKKYAVLFRKRISRQGAGKGKAILECVGLTREQIKLCYQSNPLNREEAIQGGHCTWQGILEAMKFAVVAAQHCRELEEELCQWKRCNVRK